MSGAPCRHVYGPVPSRRLGRSLGVDLVPFKTCTYDCLYCQLGPTTDKTLERRAYAAPDAVLAELDRALASAPVPDWIGLAGSGEPTLHADMGAIIAAIKKRTAVPVAVLTNGSLLWMPAVRESLMEADLVLPSLDAGDARRFRQINRPHPGLSFERMIEGLDSFTRTFPGRVWLEVFLLEGLTGIPSEVEKIAAQTRTLRVDRIQLNTAWRPAAEASVRPVPAETMAAFAALFTPEAEVVAPDETDSPAARLSATAKGDVLALLRRRPCTARDVAAGLQVHLGEATKTLQELLATGRVRLLRKEGSVFYQAEKEDR